MSIEVHKFYRLPASQDEFAFGDAIAVSAVGWLTESAGRPLAPSGLVRVSTSGEAGVNG